MIFLSDDFCERDPSVFLLKKVKNVEGLSFFEQNKNSIRTFLKYKKR
jgi:hypothetical protein